MNGFAYMDRSEFGLVTADGYSHCYYSPERSRMFQFQMSFVLPQSFQGLLARFAQEAHIHAIDAYQDGIGQHSCTPGFRTRSNVPYIQAQ
jgi:hypothetical protein